MKKFGTREEVINNLSKQTRGGLTKRFLKYNAEGKIISVRRRKQRGGVGENEDTSQSIFDPDYKNNTLTQVKRNINASIDIRERIIFYQNGKNRYYFSCFDDDIATKPIRITYKIYLNMLIRVIHHTIHHANNIYNQSNKTIYMVYINKIVIHSKKADNLYLTNVFLCYMENIYINSIYNKQDDIPTIDINNSNQTFLIDDEYFKNISSDVSKQCVIKY